jgi:hypothetical protein
MMAKLRPRCWDAQNWSDRPRLNSLPPSQRPTHHRQLARTAWQRLSAGPGAKGLRYYDWALISHPDPDPDPAAADPDTDPTDPQCWWLLVRRHRHNGELAFYRCYSPEVVPLRELDRAAGRRWTVEESF